MSSEHYELVRIANGTCSVRCAAHGETFHPVIGPAEEAEALYVRQLRLRDRLASANEEFVVWDVGLGAGGNALAVLGATRDIARSIHLISFDRTLAPLRFAVAHADALGYFRFYRPAVERLLKTPTDPLTFDDGQRSIRWELVLGDFPLWLRESTPGCVPPPHAILFDAFSPAVNPEMWTLSLFKDLFARLSPHRSCALPTYSRSTMLRVTLLLAGFFVGTGHAIGEKEETTLAANTPDLIEHPLPPSWLSRVHRSTSAEPLHSPVYRQARLSPASLEQLRWHPQFTQVPTA